jgi:hypothetical protein
MNVQRDQEVDVKLERHDGNYVQPKKKYKPFSGGGQRLGSPAGRRIHNILTASAGFYKREASFVHQLRVGNS